MIMDPKHSAEMSKHLEKQNQALMGTYRAMSHELHKLQVEEEAIMHKLYELMSAEGLLPKAALSSPKLLESHSVLKNIMEKTEDEVKLTCHTAKQKHKKEKNLERDVKESTVAGKQRTEP